MESKTAQSEVTEMKHSPLPWQVLEVQDKPFVATAAYEGHPYFERTRFVDIIGDEEYPLKRGDCELIVRAVNNHENLLTALQEIESETLDENAESRTLEELHKQLARVLLIAQNALLQVK